MTELEMQQKISELKAEALKDDQLDASVLSEDDKTIRKCKHKHADYAVDCLYFSGENIDEAHAFLEKNGVAAVRNGETLSFYHRRIEVDIYVEANRFLLSYGHGSMSVVRPYKFKQDYIRTDE